MTTTPSWLYYLFGALMLAIAAYSLAGLILAVVRHRTAGRDVDVAHIFMGVSMAGMFVTQWAFGRRALWELIFGILLTWFVVRSIQSVQRYGLHVPHEAIHAAMSFAMLLMYWFPMGSSPSGSMSMSSSTATRVDPGLAFVLAFLLLASAIFTLASPVKGASHHGTHARAYAMSGAAGSEVSESATGDAPASISIGGIEGFIAAPWLEDASHAVMCVAMAFMLILML
jgi:hypothetical protein